MSEINLLLKTHLSVSSIELELIAFSPTQTIDWTHHYQVIRYISSDAFIHQTICLLEESGSGCVFTQLPLLSRMWHKVKF